MVNIIIIFTLALVALFDVLLVAFILWMLLDNSFFEQKYITIPDVKISVTSYNENR